MQVMQHFSALRRLRLMLLSMHDIGCHAMQSFYLAIKQGYMLLFGGFWMKHFGLPGCSPLPGGTLLGLSTNALALANVARTRSSIA